MRHDRHHAVVQVHPGRDRDDPGGQAGRGDRAHDHREGLPRGHADRLEHTDVVRPLPDLQRDGVQHAKPGDHRDQDGQHRDQDEHRSASCPGRRRRTPGRSGRVPWTRCWRRPAGRSRPERHVVLLRPGARVDRVQVAGLRYISRSLARIEHLAHDPHRVAMAAGVERVRRADRGAGVGEEQGVHVDFGSTSRTGVPAAGDQRVAGPRGSPP